LVSTSNTCKCKETFTNLNDTMCKPKGDCFSKYVTLTNRWVSCGSNEVVVENDDTNCETKNTCTKYQKFLPCSNSC